MTSEKNKTDYDVVIIGAGIQGAGVAQAAAANGYRTLVIEKYPEAGLGTSSKSSKLIHGGLRYLESGQIPLVNECLEERKTLLKIAPELVNLIPFYIPVYKSSQRPAWYIYAGLLIYSLLSLKPFSIIRKKHWQQHCNLKQNDMTHLYMYYDAQTDDTQLTRAVLHSACKLGAEIIYDTTFTGSSLQLDTHVIHYTKDDEDRTLTCRSLINCSGPWVQQTQALIEPGFNLPEIELVAGTHIVIDRATQKGAYYLQASDGRAIFVIPWKNQTLIGTTERSYHGDPDKLVPLDEEIEYLISTYNSYFETPISRSNIVHSFAGLRVLPHDYSDASSRSRDSLIVQHPQHPELICLLGGKLTAYRASSEQVIKRLRKALPNRSNYQSTRTIRIQPVKPV